MNVLRVLVAVSLAVNLEGWVTLIKVDMLERYILDGENGPKMQNWRCTAWCLDNVMSWVPLEAKWEART